MGWDTFRQMLRGGYFKQMSIGTSRKGFEFKGVTTWGASVEAGGRSLREVYARLPGWARKG